VRHWRPAVGCFKGASRVPQWEQRLEGGNGTPARLSSVLPQLVHIQPAARSPPIALGPLHRLPPSLRSSRRSFTDKGAAQVHCLFPAWGSAVEKP
jgi:hypothetical protein